MNQGRVYQISSWGVQTKYSIWPGITNLNWLSDDKNTFNEDYGWAVDDDIDACSPFTLDSDDYINGYNVRYGDNPNNYAYINGITLYTHKNRILSCISNVIPSNLQSSGDIIYPNRYLSGFYVLSGRIINGIAFQFTAINHTNKCHNNNDNNISFNLSIINTTSVAIYGVTITITFDYIPANNTNLTTSQIQDILTNITSNIISNSIPLDKCIKRDGYNIIISERTNGTIINAQITTCDIETEEILVKTLSSNDLQNKFINKTLPYLKIDPSTIKLDVSTILEPATTDTEFQSTLFDVSQTMKNAQEERNSDKLLGDIKIIIICISLVIIACIIIIFYIIKCKRKADKNRNLAFGSEIKSVSYSPRSAISADVQHSALKNIPPIIDDFGSRATAGDDVEHNDEADGYVINYDNNVMTPRSEIVLAMVKMAIEDNDGHQGNDAEEKDDVYVDNPGTNDINDDNYETRK